MAVYNENGIVTQTIVGCDSVSVTGIGLGEFWSNGWLAQGPPDGTYSYSSLSASESTGILQGWLWWGFSPPTGSTIVGIETSFWASSEKGFAADSIVRLTLRNGTIGENKARTSELWPVGSFQERSYGGATDTWGITLPPSEVVTNLYFEIRATNTSSLQTEEPRIDALSLTVHLQTPPGGVRLGGLSLVTKTYNEVGIGGCTLDGTSLHTSQQFQYGVQNMVANGTAGVTSQYTINDNISGVILNGMAPGAIYNEDTQGGAILSGCVLHTLSHEHTTLFGVGDILYNLKKAKRGVLEKVVIKQLIPAKTKLTFGVFTVLYKDTFNALWNEGDLTDYTTAKALAEAYHQDTLDQLAKIKAC